MSLYHYTCDHAVKGIREVGHVLPLASMYPESPMPQWGIFAWFTDLDVPDMAGLGLTSTIISCDRTAYRFKVTDSTEVERWANVRRFHPWATALESAPGAMPAHWWVATEPVPVKAVAP